MKLSRVWKPCNEWEELRFNMWGDVDDRQAYLQKAIEFTGNARLYGSFMERVVKEWPVSTENALTDQTLNKRAWVGHAACALAFGCPEDIVRQAWGYLSEEQRYLANQAADRAIALWKVNYAKSRGLYQDMGMSLLS